jgi:hypothetical protein
MKKLLTLAIVLGVGLSTSMAAMKTLNITTNAGVILTSGGMVKSITFLNPNGTNVASWIKLYDSATNSPYWAYQAYSNVTYTVSTTNVLVPAGVTGMNWLWTNAVGRTNFQAIPSAQAMWTTTNVVQGATNTFPLLTTSTLLSNVTTTTITFPVLMPFMKGIYYTNSIPGQITPHGVQLLLEYYPWQ